MFWTILALSMTVMVGGFIAYNGDLVGRKLGKRRISLFGMRPRNTAILITTAFGLLISAFTTGILFLVVPPVRNVMLDGEESIRQNVVLTARIKRLRESSAVLVPENTRLVKQNQELTLLHERATADLESARKATSAARGELRAAIEKRDAALADRRSALADVARLQAKIGNLERIASDLERRNRSLAQQNDRLSSDNRRLAGINHDLAEKNVTLARNNATLAADNDSISKENESKVRENETLFRVNKELVDYNSKLVAQRADLERKNKELQDAQRELITVASQQDVGLDELGKRLEALRTRRITVHGGEDLARKVVPANSPPDQVRAVIGDLVHDANQAALARGAGPGNGGALAVQVVDKQFQAMTPFGKLHPVEVTESARIDALVSRLAGSDRPICLLAIAVANSVEGEPAAIDFQPFVDRLIYTRGRVIATRRLDAAQPIDKLYPELMGFLKDLGQIAIKRGVIPNIDPSTGEPQVGSLTWPELGDLVERVRLVGRHVMLTARAAEDTNSSGPLRIDFKIDPSL